MVLKYICSNCGKTFNSEEFARLAQSTRCEAWHGRKPICELGCDSHLAMVKNSNSDIRKCDYCGKQINVWRF